jgi:hypothetical protein
LNTLTTLHSFENWKHQIEVAGGMVKGWHMDTLIVDNLALKEEEGKKSR